MLVVWGGKKEMVEGAFFAGWFPLVAALM